MYQHYINAKATLSMLFQQFISTISTLYQQFIHVAVVNCNYQLRCVFNRNYPHIFSSSCINEAQPSHYQYAPLLSTKGLLFEVGSFVSMINGRLCKKLKTGSINLGSRRSSIWHSNQKSTSIPCKLVIPLVITTQSGEKFWLRNRQLMI